MALAMLKDGCVRICVMYLSLINTTLTRFRYDRWNFRGMALAMNHEGCRPNACSRTVYFLDS